MKRNFTFWRKIAASVLAFGLFSGSALHAQITIEAESTVSKTYADISDYDAFSGGAGLGGMRSAYGSYAEYVVNVEKEGTYDLTFYYSTVQVRWVYVKVNNQIHTPVEFTELTGTWDGNPGVVEEEELPGIETKTIQIYLEAGNNTLTIGGYKGFSPNLDKYVIEESSETIEKPTNQISPIVYQVENADHFYGNAKVQEYGVFTGGAGNGNGVGDWNSGGNGAIKFNKITVPEAGVYDMSIYYATMQDRSLAVKVNTQEKQIYKITESEHTPTWGSIPEDPDSNRPNICYYTIQVYMNAGDNQLVISPYDGWGPDVDRFELIKSSVDMEPYPDEVLSAIFDYTDNAVSITYEHPATETTAWYVVDNFEHAPYYVLNNISSTKVTAELQYPTLITAYSIATAMDNVSEMDKWEVEYSADGENWRTLDISSSSTDANFRTVITSSTPASENPAVAKYYRLVATGSPDVIIGEWQLHGVPYLSVEQKFPDDITDEYGFWTASDDGFNRGGDWNEVYENVYDKSINTKYTITDKKGDIWIQYEPADPVVVGSYALSVPYTTEYMGRNPKTWTLSGYVGGADGWVVLDEQSNIQFPGNGGTTLVFNVEEPRRCSAYKLDILENNGQDDTHLLQFQLFAEAFEAPELIYELDGIQKDNLTAANPVNVFGYSGVLTIKSQLAETIPYTIYNIMGQVIATGYCAEGETTLLLKAGIYVVKVNDTTTKVVIN